MEVENAGIRYSTEDEMRDNVSTQLLNPKGLACLLGSVHRPEICAAPATASSFGGRWPRQLHVTPKRP